MTAQSVSDLILMTEDFPPYNFSENGVLQGTSVDLMVQMLSDLKAGLSRENIQSLPWSRAYQILLTTKNAGLFATTRTQAREHLFKWVGPITDAENVLLARKDRHLSIRGPQDLQSYRVGAVRDDAGAQLLVQAGIHPSRLELTAQGVNSILMLAKGRIDLFAYDKNVARWLFRRQGLDPNDFEVVYTLAVGKHYFAFNKETPDSVIQALQAALDALKASGLYQKILDRYLQ